MADEQQRVTTSHTGAQAGIDSLRGVAKCLAEIGEANLRHEARVEELERDLADAEREITSLEEAEVAELKAWREVIEDYRRGVRTREELFEMTVDE